MQARSTAFLAAAALMALSTPAIAADAPPLPPPPGSWHGGAHGEVGGEVAGPPVAIDGADPRPEWREREQPMMHHAVAGDHGPHHQTLHGNMAPPQPAPRFAYSAQQRAAWIDECRANQLPRERRSGGLIGGLLGAVAGGVAGNRIADGSRLAGTLIGGGVGAVAGAVIGNAIDRGNDDERQERAIAFCEDYLSRYEAGGMAQPGYGYGYPAGYAVPMMMVAVPMTAQRTMRREEIVEEWVEEVPPARVHRRPPPAPVRAPAPVKRVPVKPVPAK